MYIAVAVILGVFIPGGMNIAAALIWALFVGPMVLGAIYVFTGDSSSSAHRYS